MKRLIVLFLLVSATSVFGSERSYANDLEKFLDLVEVIEGIQDHHHRDGDRDRNRNRGRDRDRNRGGDREYGKRYTLDIDDTFRGEDNVIKLKRRLKDEYYLERLNQKKLLRVYVEAKSKARGGGRNSDGYHQAGRIALVVGDYRHPSKRVSSSNNWRSDYRGFHDMTFTNKTGSRGRWQLRVDGPVKIKSVIVVIGRERRDRDYDYGERDYRRRGYDFLKEYKVPRDNPFDPVQTDHYIGQRISGISLRCTKESINISSVTLVLRNGDEILLREFNSRTLYYDDFLAVRFYRSLNVEQVIIHARTPKFDGRRGKLEVRVKPAY